jgi:hypothetical protein
MPTPLVADAIAHYHELLVSRFDPERPCCPSCCCGRTRRCGTALQSVTIALAISLNFRLVLLALLYRRYFTSAVARKLAAR